MLANTGASAPDLRDLDPGFAARAAHEAAFEMLEAEITELWGHINAATYRFLALVAEFDRREGWGRHGLANCAQWLNWQCGIGAVAAREKVRVARALEGLPKIADSFRRGVISYSKVRAATRIATPANEAALLNIAESGTAAHVERLVAKYRRAERLADHARAEAAHRHRELSCFYDDDGFLIIHAKLPPEVGAIVKKALDEALALIRDDPPAAAPAGQSPEPPASPESRESRESRDASQSPEPAARLDVGTAAAAGAALEPGMVLRAARNVSAETKAAAVETSLGAARADALRLLAESFLTRRSDACGTVADRFQVVVHIDHRLLRQAGDHADTIERDESVRSVTTRARAARDGSADAVLAAGVADGAGAWAGAGANACELDDGCALAVATARRLGCDCALVGIVDGADGAPLDVGRKTRAIPPALQRALKARDGGCRFPGCGRARFTEGHHVKHWADGGETKLGNLITLCRFHHRLIHEGGFGLHAIDDAPEHERFVFTRPDGTRIGVTGVRPSRQVRASLGDSNREAGLAIDWRTSRCRWLGERMDYSLAVQALQHSSPRWRESPTEWPR